MVNKINSVGDVAAAHRVSGSEPEPMRMDAAHGQQARPPLDSPSNLRLRAAPDAPVAAPGDATPSVSAATAPSKINLNL